MTQRLVDIDDGDLQAAREALSTSTIEETVGRALREAAASVARRREVERLLDGSSAVWWRGRSRRGTAPVPLAVVAGRSCGRC